LARRESPQHPPQNDTALKNKAIKKKGRGTKGKKKRSRPELPKARITVLASKRGEEVKKKTHRKKKEEENQYTRPTNCHPGGGLHLKWW